MNFRILQLWTNLLEKKVVQFLLLSVLFIAIAATLCYLPPFAALVGEAFPQTLATLIATLPVIAALIVQMNSNEKEAKRYEEERLYRILQHLLDDLERCKSDIEDKGYHQLVRSIKSEGKLNLPPSVECYKNILFAPNGFFYSFPDQKSRKLITYQVKSHFSNEEIKTLIEWRRCLHANKDFRLNTLVKVLTNK